ncbi:MAG: hypothetical protein ABI678_29315 [Kofleriaceae bacterium]
MSVLLAAAWLGVFRPAAKVEPSETRAIVGRAGEVVVLTPGDGTPSPSGEVAIVQPLVGMNVVAPIASGKIALALFALDRRDGADAVLLLPAQTVVKFVVPTAADVKAIKLALLKNEVLSGVKRSLNDLEVGTVDTDGDGKADFAVTYGCNAWADGQCQGRGAFVLARAGAAWRELP